MTETATADPNAQGGLLVLAFASAVLLPWRKPAPPVNESESAEDAAEAAVLVHV